MGRFLISMYNHELDNVNQFDAYIYICDLRELLLDPQLKVEASIRHELTPFGSAPEAKIFEHRLHWLTQSRAYGYLGP